MCTCIPVYVFASQNKNTPRPAEDDRRAAVPPQFPAQGGTLCDWLSPAYAVTGNPVTVYFPVMSFQSSALLMTENWSRTTGFLRHRIQTTSALFPCRCFHQMHPSLSGPLTLTPSECQDYTISSVEAQGEKCYSTFDAAAGLGWICPGQFGNGREIDHHETHPLIEQA